MGVLAAAALYAALSLANLLFQVALIAGAPWGRITQGGQVEGALPLRGRAVAAVSMLVVGAQAVAILSVAGLTAADWPRWTGWAALGVTGLSAILNAITPSAAERRLWLPILIVQFVAGFAVMLGTG